MEPDRGLCDYHKSNRFFESKENAWKDFYFIIKENSQNKIVQFDFMCCSAFTKDKRDYREGQRTRTILKKERIYIPTSTTTILYDQLATQQAKTDSSKSSDS